MWLPERRVYAADKREINGDGRENNWTVDPWLTGPKHQLSSENSSSSCCHSTLRNQSLLSSLSYLHCPLSPHPVPVLASVSLHPLSTFTHYKPTPDPAPVPLTQDCCKAQNG